jgi:hypothetical protein
MSTLMLVMPPTGQVSGQAGGAVGVGDVFRDADRGGEHARGEVSVGCRHGVDVAAQQAETVAGIAQTVRVRGKSSEREPRRDGTSSRGCPRDATQAPGASVPAWSPSAGRMGRITLVTWFLTKQAG